MSPIQIQVKNVKLTKYSIAKMKGIKALATLDYYKEYGLGIKVGGNGDGWRYILPMFISHNLNDLVENQHYFSSEKIVSIV